MALNEYVCICRIYDLFFFGFRFFFFFFASLLLLCGCCFVPFIRVMNFMNYDTQLHDIVVDCGSCMLVCSCVCV